MPIGSPVLHDILTGTQVDGTVFAGQHCNNWTSSAATAFTARDGHSNRDGGGMIPTSWSSAHNTTGCSVQGVASGGGRGSIYCFSAN